jgi:hypothetical protein
MNSEVVFVQASRRHRYYSIESTLLSATYVLLVSEQ